MIARLLSYLILITDICVTIDDHIPFFVMKPHTIINQTLHSYCKEQSEFNIQPMFINLTEWPTGFIYARNPYQKSDDDYDTTNEECTMELRTSIDDHIRLVFSSIDDNIRDDYDSTMSIPRIPCLRILDNDETIIYDCLTLSIISNSQSSDYISISNAIYLELIQSSVLSNDFKLFFTSLTRKLKSNICPNRNLLDCTDSYCVHKDSRCNGLNECRTKIDEKFCETIQSNSKSLYNISLIIYLNFIFLYFNTRT